MLSAEVCNWCVCIYVTARVQHLSGNDARKIKATDTWTDGQRSVYVFSKIGIGWLPGFNSSAAPSALVRPDYIVTSAAAAATIKEKRRRNARRATAPSDKKKLLSCTKRSVS